MNWSSRSYEHRGHALRRDHLLPVAHEPRDQAAGPIHPMWQPEPWWKSVLVVSLIVVPFIVWSVFA